MMNLGKTIAIYCILITLMILLVPASHAEVVAIEPVEVIAKEQDEWRKQQQQIFFRPYSKEVIGEQLIEAEGFHNIASALKDIPGVSVAEMGAFTQLIRIRGMQGPRVITLVDGIKLANQGLSRGGGGETGMVEIANVKSIEVIKGSPSVIYDPGASGGVINIITHRAPLERGAGIEQKVAYNQAFDQFRSTTVVNASTGKLSGRFSYVNTKANDYRIKGEEDKELAIARANFAGSLTPTFLEVDNLGFNTESFDAQIGLKLGDDGVIDLKWNDWTGEDMTLFYGVSIDDAIIVQYDRMERDTQSITYRKNFAGLFSDISIGYTQQSQFQAIGAHAIGVKLNSRQLNTGTRLHFNDVMLTIGGEVILDDARTAVYSEQDYYALFAHLERTWNKWTGHGGVRWNHWATRQRLLATANRVVAGDLVGISGITPEKKDDAPTFALGLQYALTARQNLSLNLSTTHRNPDLMERYSFTGILGGGLDMLPEEGRHAEITWKYLDAALAINSSIFYSEFENYIWTKETRHLINKADLLECIRLGDCNPAKGDFDDRAADFFDIFTKYYNSEAVTNAGAEINVRYAMTQHEITFATSFNRISSDDKFVRSAAHPLDSSISYRYEFSNSWAPWFRLRGQYVIDWPKVRQHNGFDPYFLASITAGFEKNNFVVSGGIRNLTDATYRAPYRGINGLARAFFVNVSYQWP